MRLGDLGDELRLERDEPEQQMPVSLPSPADVYTQDSARRRASGTPAGSPDSIAYTVSTYDSRPPVGYDVVLDNTFQLFTPN